MPAVLEFVKVLGHCEAMLDVTKYIFLLSYNSTCMIFLDGIEKKNITPFLTSKQPHKIIERVMRHPVYHIQQIIYNILHKYVTNAI